MGGGCMDGLSVSLDFLFASLVYWRTDSFGNGHETMLFLAGFLLLCTCIWQRRFSFLLPAGLLLSGFTLLVAYLSEMNPQITPLMPVLLSPWLSLHVSLIMVSYALFALMCLCSILALSIRRHAWQRQRLTYFVGSCFIRQCCAWESEFLSVRYGPTCPGEAIGPGTRKKFGL